MQSDHKSAGNGRPSAVESSNPSSELDRLGAMCRRQAHAIEALSDAVSSLRRGARALKAENAELRADSDRVRRRRGAGGRVNGGGERIEVRLALDAQAPAAARDVVADCLGERVPASVFHDARLLMSELVTNSVCHSGMPAGAELVVSVYLTPRIVRLDVADGGGNGTIAPQRPDAENGGGFGLNLVEALSERWGMERVARGGTRVWAQLARAPMTAPEDREAIA